MELFVNSLGTPLLTSVVGVSVWLAGTLVCSEYAFGTTVCCSGVLLGWVGSGTSLTNLELFVNSLGISLFASVVGISIWLTGVFVSEYALEIVAAPLLFESIWVCGVLTAGELDWYFVGISLTNLELLAKFLLVLVLEVPWLLSSLVLGDWVLFWVIGILVCSEYAFGIVVPPSNLFVGIFSFGGILDPPLLVGETVGPFPSVVGGTGGSFGSLSSESKYLDSSKSSMLCGSSGTGSVGGTNLLPSRFVLGTSSVLISPTLFRHSS